MKKKLLLATVLIHYLSFGYAQPGSLDPSFGNHGIVRTTIGSDYPSYGYGKGYQVLLSDTAIYALINTGDNAIVTKRNSDGSADVSYGGNGYSEPVGISGSHTLAIQQDGKILLAGSANKKTGDFGVARFNTDGSLDYTFGIAGRQTTDFNSGSDYGSSVKVQSDGKIVVGGDSYNNGQYYYALARYNTDGSPDKSFGKDGKIMHGFKLPGGNGGSICYSIAIQTDDKTVAAGYTSDGDRSYFAVARYNLNGSLDSTFSDDGRQATAFGNYANANSIAIQKDGKIVLTGPANVNDHQEFAVVRYNTDGNLDNSFSDDGKQTVSFTGYDLAYTVAIQPNGNIVSVGLGGGTFEVARFKPNGSIDDKFNKNVKNTIKFSGSSEAIAVAAAKDGKIVVVGDVEDKFFLFRVNNDGTADKDFANKGILIDNLHFGATAYAATAAQKDGKIVAGGYAYNGSEYAFALARYNANGSLDSTFSGDGKQITGFASYNSYITSIAIQKDGKIVAAGYTSNNYNTSFAVARYNTDGSIDRSFNGSGKVMTNFGHGQDQAFSVAIQPDGKIVVAGSALTGNTVDFAVARYNTDGSLDNSFAGDGKQTTDFGNNTDVIHSVAIDNNGKIVAAGGAFTGSNDFAIARYNSNGGLDNTFGNQGKTTTKTGDYGTANGLAIQADGKIVLAGYSNAEGNNGFTLVRYNTDGTTDASFSGDGKQYTYFDSHPAFANSIAIQSDGRLVAGGYVNTSDFTNSALARYNTDGTLDNDFADNGTQIIPASSGPNSINSIAIANNKLYAVGYASYLSSIGLVTRYILENNNNGITIRLTTPTNHATYIAPAAHIKLSAAASNSNGKISKVEFYNGFTLLHTERVFPYSFIWRNVSLGDYTLTAKAYDNSGNVATSSPVHISVVPNTPPAVRIISPANNQTFTDTATIHLVAAAADTYGRITKVEFYSGTTLLRTEYKYPYTYNWSNVPAGTYTITAVATDNWGAETTSAPITVTVIQNSSIVSGRLYSKTEKTSLNDALSLRLSPNPAGNIVNIYTDRLNQNQPATISIISVSGMVLKNIQISNSSTQLNVSSLASGIYTIKIVSGEKVLYKQFAKL